ncbi:AAA family ATPase [Pseudomonas rhodesiae]|jgi:MoxR-like ATPase|uniref:AAA family ATPase n=1 Tax=Pseudomonas rhodesiae TaxID=76760 RepID=UPI000B8BE6B4|nr:MoxR family ATPase [Pseudomonas rhodesiae]OXS21373.1 AAA family ATPase [Pseudomonas fluorescens]OZO48337.1 AAA family ATPase [Pseudomonas fluorescens]QVN04263.1 AAA family ATPase [Pseudomonas rhodesiae]TGY18583.1 AAA family ATPase [Pseudomonas fluorescens]WLG42065.1 MoxR family ATPase [Pseudomonas rhodesiae]
MTALQNLQALHTSMAASVLGQDRVIRQILLGLLANGHLLLESLPGLAKTRTVKALARHLDARMSRIQFTPDLLPSDITGAEVLHQVDGQNLIRFQPGPLFGNLILADEINRAPAKVQAALLEAMEERQITVAGASHALPPMFMVVATQNPIEQEGTYPLPEAQMDRFIMKVLLDYPSADDESQVLRLLREEEQAASPERNDAFSLAQDVIFAARREVSKIQVSPAIDRYVIDLVNATRRPGDYHADLARWISLGASPRGGIGLDRCARADAWLQGQTFVTPANVQAVAHPVLRHRLQLSYDAVAEGVTADQVLDRLLACVAIPA